MGRTALFEALVLQSHDVGEADRFCILLTRQRGRIAARARGVRKIKSRMGGSILPFNHLLLELHEGSSGWLITGVQSCIGAAQDMPLSSFLEAQQSTDLLMSTLEDDHDVTNIFEATAEFFAACRSGDTNVLAFVVHTLQLLGLLPQDPTHKLFTHLPEQEQSFLVQCCHEWETAIRSPLQYPNLSRLCERVVQAHSNRDQRAAAIAKDIRTRGGVRLI